METRYRNEYEILQTNVLVEQRLPKARWHFSSVNALNILCTPHIAFYECPFLSLARRFNLTKLGSEAHLPGFVREFLPSGITVPACHRSLPMDLDGGSRDYWDRNSPEKKWRRVVRACWAREEYVDDDDEDVGRNRENWPRRGCTEEIVQRMRAAMAVAAAESRRKSRRANVVLNFDRKTAADFSGGWSIRLEPLPNWLSANKFPCQTSYERRSRRFLRVGQGWTCAGGNGTVDSNAYADKSRH